jgi:putative SOS response-associated peptidase YedK
MPVILPPDAVAKWLNPDLTEPEHLLHMLRPYDSEPMEAYEVSRIVNTPVFNGPECIQPVHGSPPVAEVLVMNSE